MAAFRSIFSLSRTSLSRLILLVVLALMSAGVPTARAAETPEQARKNYVEAKFRAWSRAVVKVEMKLGDVTHSGTAVYVQLDDGSLKLVTADHVISDGVGRLRQAMRIRPYNADPDDAKEWLSIDEYVATLDRNEDRDLAVFNLRKPIPGLRPAKLADAAPRAGDLVIGFGYAANTGHMLVGNVTGRSSDGGTFLAMKLGADHGDSGGAVFNAAGRLVGIISSKASPEMTAVFVTKPEGKHNRSTWSRDGIPMGADTQAVNVARNRS